MSTATVCVFCGSSAGSNPAFAAAAKRLGQRMGERGLDLVYGGGSVGLMGVVAEAVARAGGRATGVIPESLIGHESPHHALSDLHVVTTMHERKALMAKLSDAFVMLPGGFGTCEEFMESVTWSQLGLHDKHCGVLNVDGYFDELLAFLRHATAQGFIAEQRMASLAVCTDVDALLDAVIAPLPGRDDSGAAASPVEPGAAPVPPSPHRGGGRSRTSRSSSSPPQSASSSSMDE